MKKGMLWEGKISSPGEPARLGHAIPVPGSDNTKSR